MQHNIVKQGSYFSNNITLIDKNYILETLTAPPNETVKEKEENYKTKVMKSVSHY